MEKQNGCKSLKTSSLFQEQEFFLRPMNITSSIEKGNRSEEEYQAELCEAMYRYQVYHDIPNQNQYVLRGSKIKCKYGTKISLIDCVMDHGVLKGRLPVMTVKDCGKENIYNFGSCLCPESLYAGRLPMAGSMHENGEYAVRAPENRFAHICQPLMDLSGWLQEESDLLIEDHFEWLKALLNIGGLVCQYGGVISILEAVEDIASLPELVEIAYQTLHKWLIGGYAVITEEELMVAMEILADYGDINEVSCLHKPDAKELNSSNDDIVNEIIGRIYSCADRQDEYDVMILAWTNYWNMTMELKYNKEYAPVRPDVVKAMVVTESNLGEKNSVDNIIKNPERDVMQSLDPRNPVLWIAVGKKPEGSITTVHRAPSDVKSLGVEAAIPEDVEAGEIGAGEKYFFENGSWQSVKDILSSDLTDYYADKVTPELSIAVAVGYYCMKLNGGGFNDGSLLRDEYTAVYKYNGEGDDDYNKKVNLVLENMGVEQLHEKESQ